MNWPKTTRKSLSIKTDGLNRITNNSSSSEWKKFRREALEKVENTCDYCGGTYDKYLFCIKGETKQKENVKEKDKEQEKEEKEEKQENPENETIVCCKLCYMVTHINYNFKDEFVIGWSKMSQVDIVRKTADLLIKDKTPPSITSIDKNVKVIPISTMELSNIIVKHGTLPDDLKHYKIFFSPELDTTFISSGSSKPLFIDESSEEFLFEDDVASNDSGNSGRSSRNVNTNGVAIHKFTKTEEEFLNKFFDGSIDTIDTKMDVALNVAQNMLGEYKNATQTV